MTIHAAKGLEFDAVILPQLNDGLIGNIHRQIALGSRPSTIAPYSELCAYPSSTHAELIPELAKLESKLKTSRASEAMSLLYVALTRAVERIEMMVPPASKSGTTDRISCLLRNGIDCVDADTKLIFADNEELCLKWQHPQSDLRSWAQDDNQEVVAQPEKTSPFTVSKTPRLLKRVAPSQAGAGNYSGADILGEFSQAAMARGSKIHALLESCEWLEDFTTDDSELQVMLSKEHVRSKLSRPPVGDFEVWRERNFSALINEGDSSYILRGCFDRVVIQLDSNGKKVAAEIIDYKTGTINDASRVKYQAQLDEYSKALQLLLDLGVDDISCCLLELDA
jgi:ATP-dependent exoDNAse (exonuclease V) beta subunit